MSNGIIQIAKERVKQQGNGRSAQSDEWINPDGSLVQAALYLLDFRRNERPSHWNEWLDKAAQRSYKERVRIAGALMAAELDRLEHKENLQARKKKEE